MPRNGGRGGRRSRAEHRHKACSHRLAPEPPVRPAALWGHCGPLQRNANGCCARANPPRARGRRRQKEGPAALVSRAATPPAPANGMPPLIHPTENPAASQAVNGRLGTSTTCPRGRDRAPSALPPVLTPGRRRSSGFAGRAVWAEVTPGQPRDSNSFRWRWASGRAASCWRAAGAAGTATAPAPAPGGASGTVRRRGSPRRRRSPRGARWQPRREAACCRWGLASGSAPCPAGTACPQAFSSGGWVNAAVDQPAGHGNAEPWGPATR